MSEIRIFLCLLIVCGCLVIGTGCDSARTDVAKSTGGEIEGNTPVNSTPGSSGSEGLVAAELRGDANDDWSQALQLSPASDVASRPGHRLVNTLRVWRDQDLKYSTTAELLEVSIEDRSVKLLKANGVAIIVPIDRLSEHDRSFLNHVVSSQRQ